MEPRADRDARMVTHAMDALQDVSQELGPLPDPSFLWWKAQLLRTFDAQEQAAQPIAVTDRLHVGAAVLGAVALAAGAWSHVGSFGSGLSAVVVTVGMLIAVSYVSLVAWNDLRGR